VRGKISDGQIFQWSEETQSFYIPRAFPIANGQQFAEGTETFEFNALTQRFELI
jgi:hypothetical protein